jgi:site-specific recombinase XerD
MKHLDAWCGCLLAADGLAPASVARYRRAVEAMGARLGDDPTAIDLHALERYVKELYAQNYSSASRALAVNAIRRFWRYLVTRGLVSENPTLELAVPRVYRRERPCLTRPELMRLVYGADEGLLPAASVFELRNRVMLYVMYLVGLRLSEPARLGVDDLAWDSDTATFSILVRGGKGARADRRMPLDEDGSRLLGFYLQRRGEIEAARGSARRAVRPLVFPGAGGAALSTAMVAKIFRQRLAAAGIEPRGRRLTPHVLRHSVATHMLGVGWDINEVREWLRHKSIATTQVYLHSDETKSAARLRRRHPLKARAEANYQVVTGELLAEAAGRLVARRRGPA